MHGMRVVLKCFWVNGDMTSFYPPIASSPIRARSFIRDEDINRVVRFIRDQRPTELPGESS